ncbi:MAG: hypothetical protein M1825_003361 [Sarcosagium campestre]|nr:MAG: hypothetical protein M1825_003361 [Sarcosagium campestre]
MVHQEIAPTVKTRKRKAAEPALPAKKKARSASSDSEQEEDDQTETLLKDLESDEDDSDDGTERYQETDPVPAIPNDKNTQLQLKEATNKGGVSPGAVYVGRIPHGFYEPQMRAYFTQFGSIRRLRLSRNRKTGQSKHYAFIEFESAEVAKVVADTMNNYLLFGHILKCKVIPPGQVHENLWKGANKRFQKVPWNLLEGKKLDAARSKKIWDEKAERTQKRREQQRNKLKEIGYDFELPQLKSTDDVPKRPELVDPATEAPLTIQGAGNDAPQDSDTETAKVTKSVTVVKDNDDSKPQKKKEKKSVRQAKATKKTRVDSVA